MEIIYSSASTSKTNRDIVMGLTGEAKSQIEYSKSANTWPRRVKLSHQKYGHDRNMIAKQNAVAIICDILKNMQYLRLLSYRDCDRSTILYTNKVNCSNTARSRAIEITRCQ